MCVCVRVFFTFGVLNSIIYNVREENKSYMCEFHGKVMLSLGSLEKEQIPQHHCDSSAATAAAGAVDITAGAAAAAATAAPAAAAAAVCLETLGDVKDVLETGFKI